MRFQGGHAGSIPSATGTDNELRHALSATICLTYAGDDDEMMLTWRLTDTELKL